MNPQHFGRYPTDIRIWINPAVWIGIPGHFWLKFWHWRRFALSELSLVVLIYSLCLPMCQVPVLEGKEPPCFVRLFNGHMIIHSGKREEAVSRRWRLYMLRNELPLEAYLWEIPTECRNLRSRASFVLVDCEKSVLYVWHGTKSSLQSKQRVVDMANWIIERWIQSFVLPILLQVKRKVWSLDIDSTACLCCGCSDVVVEYRTSNWEVAGSTHTRSTASNLEQVTNLLCAQANSASYPQRDGKWVVAQLLWATGWMPSVADWGDGVSASCTVGPIVH